jgi:hypothetical protein
MYSVGSVIVAGQMVVRTTNDRVIDDLQEPESGGIF